MTTYTAVLQGFILRNTSLGSRAIVVQILLVCAYTHIGGYGYGGLLVQ